MYKKAIIKNHYIPSKTTKLSKNTPCAEFGDAEGYSWMVHLEHKKGVYNFFETIYDEENDTFDIRNNQKFTIPVNQLPLPMLFISIDELLKEELLTNSNSEIGTDNAIMFKDDVITYNIFDHIDSLDLNADDYMGRLNRNGKYD